MLLEIQECHILLLKTSDLKKKTLCYSSIPLRTKPKYFEILCKMTFYYILA